MSFFDFLQTVGGRLGILEASAQATPGTCTKIVTRIVTIEELRTQIRSEEVRTLADLPAELTIPYEKIFEAAGVQSAARTWNVARLKTFLRSEPFAGQERAAAQKALLEALSADQVNPEDLIKEATAQDQALDAFENHACKKVEDHMALAEHQAAELEARIRALQAERALLAERIGQDQEKLREWRKNKRTYERELAGAIGYLTDRAVITTDNEF